MARPDRVPTASVGVGTRPGAAQGGVPTPFAQRVLDVVERIPRGRVMTYGDVADAIGSRAPRAVGNAMARWGGATHWQRVVQADGSPPACAPAEATRLLRADEAPLLRDGRVDLRRARWDPEG